MPSDIKWASQKLTSDEHFTLVHEILKKIILSEHDKSWRKLDLIDAAEEAFEHLEAAGLGMDENVLLGHARRELLTKRMEQI